MTAENQFKPFATGVGATTLTASEWASLVNLIAQGFQDGVVPSEEFNTVMRGPSSVSSMLGQFVVNFLAETAADDGDISTLLDQFERALQKFLQPLGVYFIQDTGSANAIVGTSANPPSSYSACRLVIVKKMAADNAGPMTADLWNIGPVSLKDNTGADLASGAARASSFYMLAPNGPTELRILGGATTYTSVSNLTANSGDGVEVTTGGLVNRRSLRGTHSTSVNNLDRVSRGKSDSDIDLYMTIAEWISYLNGALNFLSTVPPNGPGVQVGQWMMQVVGIEAGHTPGYAGFSRGSTLATASQIQNGTWAGVNPARIAAWASPNVGDHGFSLSNWYGEAGFNEIEGVMAGNWLYKGCFETVSYAMWNQYILIWERQPD